MRRYWLLSIAMLVFFLALFGVVQALGVHILTDPRPWMNDAGFTAGAVGVALLVVDVLLPVPSSFVMVAHGALFGVLLGAALSLLGSVGAAAVAFWIGRRGERLIHRLVPPAERARADALLARWGGLALVATRPVPLLAETVAILAGASPLSWRTLLSAATLGSAPPALLYALTGASVARLDSTLLVFGVVLLVAGGFWFLGRRVAAPES